jgi:hypothetical protein
VLTEDSEAVAEDAGVSTEDSEAVAEDVGVSDEDTEVVAEESATELPTPLALWESVEAVGSVE